MQPITNNINDISTASIKTLDEIKAILVKYGNLNYYGSPVTQLEHALQCAMLAEEADSRPELITAALLHDLGHLTLYSVKVENQTKSKIDFRHQDVIIPALSSLFSDAVLQPIALHVDAKRYLCATDKSYLTCLSEDSLHSLQLQGGPFTEIEAKLFIEHQYAEDAIKLRRWDDEAKLPNKNTPNLDYFLNIAETVLI